MPALRASSLACLLLLPCALANMYDVITPALVPPAACTGGCAAWSSLNTTVKRWFADQANVALAQSACAQLGRAPALSKQRRPVLDHGGIGGQGAFCFCSSGDSAGSAEWGYCTVRTTLH